MVTCTGWQLLDRHKRFYAPPLWFFPSLLLFYHSFRFLGRRCVCLTSPLPFPAMALAGVRAQTTPRGRVPPENGGALRMCSLHRQSCQGVFTFGPVLQLPLFYSVHVLVWRHYWSTFQLITHFHATACVMIHVCGSWSCDSPVRCHRALLFLSVAQNLWWTFTPLLLYTLCLALFRLFPIMLG